MYTTPQTNGVLVSWEDIPSHQQMGCITAYNIYLRKKDSEGAPAVYGRCLVKNDEVCTCCALRGEGWGERCLQTALYG